MEAVLNWAWAHPWIALALLWFTPLGDLLSTVILGVTVAIWSVCFLVVEVVTAPFRNGGKS